MKRDLNILKAKEVNTHAQSNQKLITIVLGAIFILAFLGIGIFAFKVNNDFNEFNDKKINLEQQITSIINPNTYESNSKKIQKDLTDIENKERVLTTKLSAYLGQKGTLNFGIIDSIVFNPNGNKGDLEFKSLLQARSPEENVDIMYTSSFLKIKERKSDLEQNTITITAKLEFYFNSHSDLPINTPDMLNEKGVIKQYEKYLDKALIEVLYNELPNIMQERSAEDFEIVDTGNQKILRDKKTNQVIIAIKTISNSLLEATTSKIEGTDYAFTSSNLQILINKDSYVDVIKALKNKYSL